MSKLSFSFFLNNNALVKTFSIYACCILFALSSDAQVNVTSNQTASVLAQKLVGKGVTITNPTLTCAPLANGIFSVTSSNLGLDSGIVLTNGTAKTSGSTAGIDLSSGTAANTLASTGNGTPGDAQLTALSGQTTHDACVLQFDFQPSGDTVKFDYVFGSEEYTGYACTEFNDVFGFFISGGAYTTATNIALVPGTNIPVAVNTVNDGPGDDGGEIGICNAVGPGSPFMQYYVNNLNGTTITYDGFTTVLEAIAAVSPCNTYHLKLGVADASDDILDSGVFLKAGSLSSNGAHVTSAGLNEANSPVPYCVRGCLPGEFIFSIPTPTPTALSIKYLIAGSAVNGYDYAQIADSIVIPAHDSVDTLVINPLAVPPAGSKTVMLLIRSPYACSGMDSIIDSATLTIYDSFSVHIITPDTAICLGKSVNIITESDSFLTYVWTPSAGLNNTTILSPTATPDSTTTYMVTANFPRTGCPPSTDQIIISTYKTPTLVTPNFVATCVGTPAQFYVNVTPGSQAYSYSWSPGVYLNNTTIDSAIATPTAVGDTTYTITVSTVIANCTSTDTVHLHVLPNSFTISPLIDTICIGSAVQVIGNGDAEFTYVWTPTTGVSNPDIINPAITPPSANGAYPATDVYAVTASYPGCPDMIDSLTIVVDTPAPSVPILRSTCVGIPIQFNVTAPGSEIYQYSWSPATYLSNDTIANPIDSPTVVGDVVYVVTAVSSGAVCKTFDTVKLHVVPNDFTIFNKDTAICKGASIQINALGDTEFAYTWIPTAGVSNYQSLTPLLTPDTSENYTITATYPGCPDMVHTLSVDVQPNPIVYLEPSIFTCQFDTVHLNPVITPWGYPDYTYTWTPATGLDNPNMPDVVFSADSVGSFNLVFSVSTPAGCQNSDSTLITVRPGQFASLLPAQDTAICPGDSVQFTASGAVQYQWVPADLISDSTSSSPVAHPTATQNYTLIATSEYGCHDTFNVNIVVHPAAVLDLGDSVTLYPGQTYQMSPGGNCLTFSWFPPQGLSATNISNPVANPDVNTKYIVTASTEWGCSIVDSINIYADPNTLLALPNAFTPGNGPNNEFKIIKLGIATLNYFRIFNRWGEQVFETNNIDEGWDGTYKGTPQPFGVFVYEVEAITNTGRRFVKQGNVTLIR